MTGFRNAILSALFILFANAIPTHLQANDFLDTVIGSGPGCAFPGAAQPQPVETASSRTTLPPQPSYLNSWTWPYGTEASLRNHLIYDLINHGFDPAIINAASYDYLRALHNAHHDMKKYGFAFDPTPFYPQQLYNTATKETQRGPRPTQPASSSYAPLSPEISGSSCPNGQCPTNRGFTRRSIRILPWRR